MDRLERIVVIKWGALGDLIAGTVALSALRRAYPDAFISAVTVPLMRDICPEGSLVDQIIEIDPSKKEIGGTIGMVKRLRSLKFDGAVNLRWSSERSAILAGCCGAGVRAGSGPKGWRWIYNRWAAIPEGRRHEFLRHTDIVAALGITVGPPEPYVHIAPSDREFSSGFLAGCNTHPGSFAIMHPGASTLSKAWPADRYAGIGRNLVSKHGARIVVTWGGAEQPLAREVVSRIGEGAFLAPRTSVGTLAALLSSAKLCLCNYSGVMNVAMATQTPLVALGCTSPEDWGPYGDLHRTVNSGDGNDSYSDTERAAMMKNITLDAVWNAVDSRWRELSDVRLGVRA